MDKIEMPAEIAAALELGDATYLDLAARISEGAPCTRSKVGAVVVTREGTIVSADFNRGGPYASSCLEGGCPRGNHYQNPEDDRLCACGNIRPCPDEVEPGSQYDTGPGRCISVHAEANAIINAGRGLCKGATLYCTREPCWWCEKIAMEVQVSRIKWPEGEKVYASTVDS